MFYADEDYYKYLDTLRQAGKVNSCAIHAYVLMTNHVHLLVTPERKESLSLMMQSLNGSMSGAVAGVVGLDSIEITG